MTKDKDKSKDYQRRENENEEKDLNAKEGTKAEFFNFAEIKRWSNQFELRVTAVAAARQTRGAFNYRRRCIAASSRWRGTSRTACDWTKLAKRADRKSVV